uniref:Fimbrillin family protein n=1 Tax=uncultured bacterium Contigcl_1493 TaxID=1393647 RepID=W0FQV9_9BACT|nr:hypothetical protein [uncultured bacterium Contigcl_1493]
MKKYLILAAAAAVTLAACAKVETAQNALMDENSPIVFSNYAPKSLVKADAASYAPSTTLVLNTDFDVWGWSTSNGTAFDGSNGARFMGWYTVTYKDGGATDGSKNAYPDGYRYWPSGDAPDWLSFYAYYPSKSGSGITPPANGLGGFSFTAKEAAADQVDFMVADVVADQLYTTNNGTVPLTFRHMLTKVQVNFKTTTAVADDANTTVKITGATFNKIKNAGTLTASYAASATSTAWTAVSGAQQFAVAYPAGALTVTASTVAPADIFLMVPQTMLAKTEAAAQYLEISWTVTTDGVTTENTAKLYLDDCVSTDGGSEKADLDWEKNHFVTYTVTVGPQPILFTATVAEWESAATGYFNVQ